MAEDARRTPGTTEQDTAERYLADVHTHLDVTFGREVGHYIYDPDETPGGAIPLRGILADGRDLVLIWEADGGWHAGHPRPGGGADCLTNLWIGFQPEPHQVVNAVWRILRDPTQRLEAGRPVRCPDWCTYNHATLVHWGEVGRVGRTQVSIRLEADGTTAVEIDHADQPRIVIPGGQAPALAAWMQDMGNARQAALIRKAARTLEGRTDG